MALFLNVHPDDPQPRLIAQIADQMRDGALIAYPTSSGYALGAALGNTDAKERIIAIRRLDAKHDFTLVCRTFAELGQLVQMSNSAFRAIKAATPGPYTFILPATSEVPRRLVHPKKKTVGVRLDAHPVAQALAAQLGEPIMSTSLVLPGREEPFTFGWDVKEELDHVIDTVIDAGEIEPRPTTVVDFTGVEPVVVRVGAGDPARFEG